MSNGTLKAVVRRSNHRFGLVIVDVVAVTDEGSVLDATGSYYPHTYVCALFDAEINEKPFKFGDYSTGDIMCVLPNVELSRLNENVFLRQGVIIDRSKEAYQVLADGEVRTVAWDKLMPTGLTNFTWQTCSAAEVLKPLILGQEENKSVIEQ